MNPTQQISGAAVGGSHAVHVLCMEGNMKLTAHDLEEVLEDIRMRATKVGCILEGILHEPHGEAKWNLNE